jgi:hypothetical protein
MHLGSRSGSWFELALFAVMFGSLGWMVSRELHRRSPRTGRWFARLAGLLLFVGPVALVYASSVNGFYEATLTGPVLRLEYLFPGSRADVLLAEIDSVEAAPWFRGRYRLLITARSGQRYESATWHREETAEAAARLRLLTK